jgi:hypothetical protein
MRTGLVSLGVSALALLAALPAAAKTDPKKKDGPAIRWSHTYAAALEEAKERGCVVFATFHAEH